jgi:deoxycytidylate deaminase
MNERISWDNYFMKVAECISLRSPDSHKRVGTIIVNNESKRIVSTGYNGLPKGVNEKLIDWTDRDLVRSVIIHSECNAVLRLTYNDEKGDTLYCTLMPCPECIKMIKTAGITTIYYKEKYKRTFEESLNLCKLFNITLKKFTLEETQ